MNKKTCSHSELNMIGMVFLFTYTLKSLRKFIDLMLSTYFHIIINLFGS